MKKILVIGKPALDGYGAIDYLKLYFQIQMAENAENAQNMITVYHPDLLLVVASDITEETSLIFHTLRMTYAQLPFMTMGTMDEKRNAEYYLYSGIENIALPFEGKRAIQQLAAKLGIPDPTVEQSLTPMQAAGRKKVLVVDDNAPTLRSIKGLLDDHYQVLVAPSGEKALQIMSRNIPQLVLLDYEMPGMTGKEVLQIMRQNEILSLIPVVFLTAVNDKDQILEILSMKPQGYLLKPVTLEKLLTTIQRLIGT